MVSVGISQRDLIVLSSHDNVAVAARHLPAGAEVEVDGCCLRLLDPIPICHKVATKPIAKGQPIRKYGQIIGFASDAIAAGQWVHTHNVVLGRLEHDYAFCSECPPDPVAEEVRYFWGYERADGRVGTRNYICIISTVNCAATAAKYAAERFRRETLREYSHVDGVFAVIHKSGCGLQYGGLDHQLLSRALAGFARHPNVGAYLLVGLGCETGQVSYLLETQQLVYISNIPGLRVPGDGSRPKFFSIQECGGIPATVERLVAEVARLLPLVNSARRTRQPASKLCVALQCGGSDGASGITANPALGIASDLVVAQGGTTILSETPEVYGAEHLLTRRAKTPEIAQKLLERIKWWEWYTSILGAQLDNNPSAGNKAGGITTIYEKSLGAVAKGGRAPLSGVFEYAEPIRIPGFVFMDSPGFDPVSVTGQVAAGATVVCFTTGRGSCYGCKPAPTIKICTNSHTYERMISDMDINAGVVFEGVPLEEVGRQIFELILAVASGEKTKSEWHGMGDEEFAPWTVGPVL
jgi:altronate hydrolase